MIRSLFKSFYDGNIDVIAEQIVKHNAEFSYNRNLDGVYEEYLNQKTFLRTLIKNSDIDDKDDTHNLLDGHKVSACITCAIIKVRLITNSHIEDDINNDRYILDKTFRLNEQVALLSGLSCLLEYMADDKENLYTNETDKTKTCLRFPKTSYEERSTYLDSLIRALHYSNIFSTVNPLLLSNIFFLIEKYHRQNIELIKLKNKKDI